MGKKTTVGITEADLSRFKIITFTVQKEQTDLMHLLCTELLQLLKYSVQYSAKNGNPSFFFDILTKRRGLTLEINFMPKANLVAEKIDMNAPNPTTSEIESKLFGETEK